MTTSTETVERLIEIALNIRGTEPSEAINANTPLTNILDSFAFFDFLLHVEETFGVEIDTETIPDGEPLTASTFAGLVAAQQG